MLQKYWKIFCKNWGCPKRAASMYENNKKKVAMQLQV
jgi:hypothetical protein